MQLLAALLASAFPLSADAGEAQLLPFGEFAARDGRPGPGKTWKIDDARGRLVAQQLNAIAAQTPVVIDYEHQTELAEKNGQPAPAAGWMKTFDWRPGKGLFAAVEWTARAKAAIDAREYLFVSPVLLYEKVSGLVAGIKNAALVNQPAILGMAEVVAQLAANFNHSTNTETRMDLNALLALLGLKPEATDAEINTAVAALKTKPPVSVAIAKALGLAETADEAAATTAIATLKTSGDAATLAAMKGLNEQIATLSAKLNGDDLTRTVDAAIAANKLLPAQRDWAISLGTKDLASLKGFVDTLPVIPGLGGQSGGKDPAAGAGGGALSADQLKVATQLGLDPTKFAEALKAQA